MNRVEPRYLRLPAHRPHVQLRDGAASHRQGLAGLDAPRLSPSAVSGTVLPLGRQPLPLAVPVSVVILTLNEECNLAACLESLVGFDDVHVVDSGSTDGTTRIAAALGAEVSFNRFSSFGQQRNWSHDQVALRHRWVLHLDADERMTPALMQEIRETVAADTGALAGFYIAERTILNGRWLRHAGQFPRYQARLVHRDRMRFIDHGHGQRELSELPIGRLGQPYDHLAFSHGIEHWLHKHVGYAVREAEAELAARPAWQPLLGQVARGSATERRRALKSLSTMLPLRPLLRWLYVMFIAGGCFDGAAGWQYARMMKTFQQMIDMCVQERRTRPAGQELR